MGIADFIIVAGYVYTWVNDIIYLTEDVFVEVAKCFIVQNGETNQLGWRRLQIYVASIVRISHTHRHYVHVNIQSVLL